MSLFYLLSGFIMTLGYGAGFPPPVSAVAGKSGSNAAAMAGADVDHAAAFDRRRFLTNRLARVLPMYLLTNLSSIPLHVGYFRSTAANPLNLFLTATGMNMWLLPFCATVPGFELLPPNGASWTIQTMMGFYVLYPLALPYLRRQSRPRAALIDDLY